LSNDIPKISNRGYPATALAEQRRDSGEAAANDGKAAQVRSNPGSGTGSPGIIAPPLDPGSITIAPEVFFRNSSRSNVPHAQSLGSFGVDISARLNVHGEEIVVIAINPDFKTTNDHPAYGKNGGDAYLDALALSALEYCERAGIEGATIYKDGTSFYLLLPPDADAGLLKGLDMHLRSVNNIVVRDRITGEPLGEEPLRIEDPHVKTVTVLVRGRGQGNGSLEAIVVMDAMDKIACALNMSEDSMGVRRVDEFVFDGAADRQLAKAREANRVGQSEMADWMARELVVDHLVNVKGMNRADAVAVVNQRPDLLLMGYERLQMQYVDPQSGLLTYDVFVQYSVAQARQGRNMYVIALDGNRFSAFRTSFPFPVGPNAQSLVARERAAWAAGEVNNKYAGEGVEIAIFRRGPGSDEFFICVTSETENPELIQRMLKDFDIYLNKPLWMEIDSAHLLEYLNKLPPKERAVIGLPAEGRITEAHLRSMDCHWVKRSGRRYLINITGDPARGLEGAPRMRPVYFYNVPSATSIEALAAELGIPVEVLMEANGLQRGVSLMRSDRIIIPNSYYKRHVRNSSPHLEHIDSGCEVYRGIHMDAEFTYLTAEEINSHPDSLRKHNFRKIIDGLELEITSRKDFRRQRRANVQFYRQRVALEKPYGPMTDAPNAVKGRSAGEADYFYVNGEAHPNRPTGEAYQYIDGAEVDAAQERITESRMKGVTGPAEGGAPPSEIKVVGTRTFGAALVGITVEIPLSMLEQWHRDGEIDYDQVMSDAGHSGMFLAGVGGGQYVAARVGVPEAGAVQILFIVPATHAWLENPEDVAMISTGTVLNYAAFEAGLKHTPGPWWCKLAGGLIASRLTAMGYEHLLTSNPEAIEFMRSDTGQALGSALGFGSWAYVGYSLGGGPGAVLASLLVPSSIGYDFGGEVLTGGIYEFSTGGSMTEIEHPDAIQVNDDRPKVDGISLERSNMPYWERTGWTIEDMLYKGNQRLHFETFIYLYKLGYISREDALMVFGEDAVEVFDKVDFSKPKTYQKAYGEFADTWKMLCGHTKYRERTAAQERIMVGAIRSFKADLHTFLGEEADGSRDVYGPETAQWLLMIIEAEEAQRRDAISRTEMERWTEELETPGIIDGRRTGD